ncbi:unnamed protein product [Parnassius apollo]|uniref:(apollo) hypothetical protein n=1 Tax=Parnassius apollo TaxID=110799 RepID=A0A8S3Y4J9_PARAO|nr:unnamed protein product [Parnassius apollo]
MDKSPIVVQQIRARKRLSDKNKWKRNVAKLERSVCKKNKRTSEIDAQNVQTMGIIKSAKVKDVNKLLTTLTSKLTSHFGDSWRTFPILCFYDKLIPQNVEADVDQQEDEENICEENVDLPDVRI